MKRATLHNNPASRLLQALIWAAALTGVACDNDINFSPTAPKFGDFPFTPNTTPGEGRNLEIEGSLTAEQGSCLEATVLYDGEEVPGARAVCRTASGCGALELKAVVTSTTGDHRISFRVVRQSSGAIPYLVQGTVKVLRDGISLGGANLPLAPTRATLQSGESVDFDITFQN